MRKLYQVLVTFDNGRVIRGPFITENTYAEWKELFDNYPKFDNFRFSDSFRRVIIPEAMIQRSYIDIRRASYLRMWITALIRFVTK